MDEAAGLLRCSGFYQAEAPATDVEFKTVTQSMTFKKGLGLPGRVWATGRPAWIPNVQEDSNFPRAPYAARAGLHAAFAIPIISSGRIVGVLEFFRKDSLPIDQSLLESMRVLGMHLGQFLDRKTMENEKAKIEAQFIQSQKMEAVGRLAGGVAHDFNNLLTAISGYSELLMRSLDPNDPRCADVEEIKKAGVRAASLTRQLLVFSRKQVMQLKILDLNSIATDTQKMLARLIGEDIELTMILSPTSAVNIEKR